MKANSLAGIAMVLAGTLSLIGGANAQDNVERVAYVNGSWFDGEAFVAERKVVVRGMFLDADAPADREVDLGGAFVIPPFADAHTHEFDGPWAFDGQNENHLRAGTFYAMTMTAPTSGVAQVRQRFSDHDTVDVATSLGGLTGPSSHPAEIYEAVALRIYGYDQQVARQAEIRESTRMRGDAYWVVENEASLAVAWRELMRANPDVVKVFLRHSAQYTVRRDNNWAIGGIDPALLPAIAKRAEQAGIRLAVATSDLPDFRAAVDVGAAIITHLPCYQDTSEPGLYYYESTDANCLISPEDAARAAAAGSAVTLIASEFAKEQVPDVRRRLEANVNVLRDAGAQFAIGSNAYGQTVTRGLIAEADRGLFSNSELLRIATGDTAQLIFPDRALGCFDPGCEASFIALDANPLLEMSAIDTVSMRVKRGKPLDLPPTDQAAE